MRGEVKEECSLVKLSCESWVSIPVLESLMYVSLLVPDKSERSWRTLFNLVFVNLV